MATCIGTVDEDGLLFVSPPPDYLQLKCPICLELFVDRSPHLVDCCGNHICGSCINNLTNKPCPLCKSVLYKKVLDKGHQRAVNGLKVYCTNKKKGCNWSGELKTLSQHVSRNIIGHRSNRYCQYELEFMCRYKCGHKDIAPLLTEHETNSCSYRRIVCQYCMQYESTYKEVTTSHYKVCSHVPVKCSNGCGQSIKRNAFDAHLTNDCVLRKIPCEFVEMGCKWIGTFKQLQQHLTDDWRHHIAFATLHSTKEHQNEMMKLNRTIAHLHTRVADLEKELQVTRNSDLVNRVASLEEAQHENISVWNRINRLESDQANTSCRINTLKKEIDDQIDLLASDQVSTSDKVDELRDRIDGLDELRDQVGSLENFQEQLMEKEDYCEAISSNGDTVIIDIPDGESEDITTLYVDRFTHKCNHNNLHGTPLSGPIYDKHKLQVLVHCNGIGDGHGTHVSITAFCSHFYGQYLKGELFVTLLSGVDDCPAKYGVLVFDGESDKLEIEKFISVEDLDNFLCPNDTLCFEFEFYSKY